MTAGTKTSPQVYAKLAGWLYVITILAGSSALAFAKGRLAANLIMQPGWLCLWLVVRGVDVQRWKEQALSIRA